MSTTDLDLESCALLTGETVEAAAAAANDSVTVRTRTKQRVSLNSKRRRSRMSRRANLIGICGVSSLCILLLIATTQHRPLTSPFSSGNSNGNGNGNVASSLLSNNLGGRNGGGGYYERQQQQQPSQTAATIYNMTATIVDVLAAQRARILTEMENFEYPRGGAEKLNDMTLETGGTPVRSIVVTSWRSGSTFLGDILNAIPGNYYHYEPLLDFGIKQVRDPDDQQLAVQNLKNLLNCDYGDMTDYLEYGKTHTYLFEHNQRLWDVCREYPRFCWRPAFLTPFCRLFPIQSMKTVRLRLAQAEQLLQDQSLSNMRIVLLVRDPRGTMQSRRHRVWCAGNEDCEDPALVCQDLVDDYKTAETLLKSYPGRFRTLRYEDLSLNPYDVTQDILQFYGLPFDPAVEEFLDTHTKENIGGVSSTYRDSRSAPFHWKQDLKAEEIKQIQDVCVEAMDLWGYRRINDFSNFTNMQQNFDPIVLPSPFT
ncbi:carbohydrate sulfotransferase 4 [Drosophila nasuta]|uniref:Carbohydrate sulfotransferase 4 n=1 Tax=Drosophila albomicans TaxID=7291 RepID=A0A6P8XJW9_DROAB|nr:carbohydrate sulfotransferase 4 [Drosophila albomicans]XP_060665164.1 carbohydrate sulfotransferase 4 [Drosophila nasuta]